MVRREEIEFSFLEIVCEREPYDCNTDSRFSFYCSILWLQAVQIVGRTRPQARGEIEGQAKQEKEVDHRIIIPLLLIPSEMRHF